MSDSDQIDRANRATAIAKAKRAAAEARAAEAKAVAAERSLDGPRDQERDGAPPWERREDETSKAWRAFLIYRAQERRSLRRVAAAAKTSYPRVSRWSRENGWVSRVEAWDDHLAGVQAREAEAAARATGETLGLALGAGLEVTRLAFEGILRDPNRIARLKFADLVHAIGQLGKLDQLLDGRATERVETTSPATLRADRLTDLWSTKAGRELLAEARSVSRGPRKALG